MSRREFVAGTGLTALAGADLLMGCASTPRGPGGATPGIQYFSRFGVDEALLRRVLARALSTGGDYADIFFQHRATNSLSLQDGEVKQASSYVALGAGVRVIRGDQTGYAYTEDLTPESLTAAALAAAAISEGPAREAPASFQVESRAPRRYPVRLPWEEVRPEPKIALLNQANALLLKQDGRVKRAQASFNDESGAILVADSTGRIVEDLQPMTTMAVSCVAEQGGRREENAANFSLRGGFELYTPELLERLAKAAVARTTILFEAEQPVAGVMPVVLGPGTSGVLLHEAIGHGMEADFNRKGQSIYSDQLGKPIARPFVNIVDDGTQEAARGALNVDDEGNIAGRTVLVEEGRLVSYLHDLISARHYGVQPTGNGRRESYMRPPLPRMRSTYMLPGPHKPEEIIASVKRGIYCERLTNGQVRIGPGDFSFYVKNGYLIEDGRLTRPIKDVNLVGNGPQVLRDIDMVADDLEVTTDMYTCMKNGQNVPVSVGMPTVRITSLMVGGRSAG